MNKEAAPFFKLSLLIFNLSTSLESGEKSGSFHGFWPGDDQRLLGFGVWQSKRLPYIEARAVQIRPAGNTQSSWIDELQHSTSQSIIISEVLDAQTKEVIAEADPREIVISDEMVSMALAMVAEDKQINGVLDELFAEEVSLNSLTW
jgi:hypothetical protein